MKTPSLVNTDEKPKNEIKLKGESKWRKSDKGINEIDAGVEVGERIKNSDCVLCEAFLGCLRVRVDSL